MLNKLTIVTGLLFTLPVASRGVAEQPISPLREGLILNDDCTIFFYTHSIPDKKAGEIIDHYIDFYAMAGVKTLICNINARRTNYKSRVWDSFWNGYDPDGPDDQPFFSAIPKEDVIKYRNLIGQMMEVHRQGIDYPARVTERCRHHGISPWISLRMNDCHYADNPSHPFHGDFWKKNPQFRVNPKNSYFGQCLNYAHEQVRDYYKSLIIETLDRYDIDGLELDFMRESFLFTSGKEADGGEILTAWLRDIRKLVDETAERRGHPIRLGVRVPSRPETAKAVGLDAVAWAKEGLVDLVVPTPRWATIEFDMPIRQWRELLAGTNAMLAGGLEVLYRPHKGLKPRPVTPELAAGAAAMVLSRGADTVYLFNYFQDGHPDWPEADYIKTLRAMNSLDELKKLPRAVGLTYRDLRAAGENYRPPLPASGKRLAFSLDPGPLPKADWQCVLTIAMRPTKDKAASTPRISVNGHSCQPRGDEQNDGFRVLSFLVPGEALADGKRQKIEIDGDGSAITAERLEMAFRPAD